MGDSAYCEVSLKQRDGGLLSVADGQPFRRIMELEDSLYFQCTATNCPAIMLVRQKMTKGLLISKHNPNSHQSRYSVMQLFRLWVWWTARCALRIVSMVTGIPLPTYYQDASTSPDHEQAQVHQNPQSAKEGWISWVIATVLWSLRYALFFVNPTWGFILGRLIPAATPTSNSPAAQERSRK